MCDAGTSPYVSCHQDAKTIEYREQRAQRNSSMPTSYQIQMAQMQHEIMNNLIKVRSNPILVHFQDFGP